MKKIYIGFLFVSVLAQPVFGMEEEHKSEDMHLVVRSPQEQEKRNKELLSAIDKDDLSRVKKLIKQGANVNAMDIHGWTCLHVACSIGTIEVIKVLLACNDIQLNVVNNSGLTPLNIACLSDNNREMVKLFLKKLIKPTVSWQQARLVWIGHLKEQADCNLAKLPAEMIYYILGFCGDKRTNIESLKDVICYKDKDRFNIAYLAKNNKLRNILKPQSWQDDKTAHETYDQLLKLLKDDAVSKRRTEEFVMKNQKTKKKQSKKSGLQQE